MQNADVHPPTALIGNLSPAVVKDMSVARLSRFNTQHSLYRERAHKLDANVQLMLP